MFTVLQIDHVELFVPDRYDAATWYERVLGLQIVPECEAWAVGGGPLMISSDGGSTKLALFNDPYGHQLEVTTYEHDATSAWLASK